MEEEKNKKKTTSTRKKSTTKKTTPKKKTTSKKKTTTSKTVKKKTTTTRKKSTTKTQTTKKKTTPVKKTATSTKKAPVKKATTKKPTKREILLKKRKKRKNIIVLSISILIFIIVVIFTYLYEKMFIAPTIFIKDVYLKDDSMVVIKFKKNNNRLKNKVYCITTLSNKLPDINDINWKLLNNDECVYELDQNIYYAYLKNEDNKIFTVSESSKIGTIRNLKINEELNYISVNDSYTLKLSYDKLGFVLDDITWTTSDKNIISISNGKVTGLKSGNATITASILDKTITSKVIVTNLITKRPKNGFDTTKKDLTCNLYSKKDNELLDEILKFKVNKVGNKTRAGVVEAARFLTLDFPYKINYFYENGRLGTNKVDGEGRYYHKGLYLDESKYSDISHSRKGPKTWGCSLYSVPDKKPSANGLDCSGFVSWAILNGGFNPGDIGAGITAVKDLTNLGTLKKLTPSLSKGKEIKVGDLLHNTWNSGHIAIIIGIDQEYYYVAQAIWFDEVGVVISKYKKSELSNKFKEVILMDKYYKKDGKLTNMW